MILEKQTNAVILEEGETQETIGMSLDLDSAQILMQMLSKNLYSDSIGSTIRECASNALDSHRRAGVTDPIIVSMQSKDNSYEFSVEDFGVGLDADDVKNIISKYGKSTKRNSANELGMMGLGFKAPLAYSSSFYFVARKNGVERKYMMYEGEDVNSIDLLYETPTDQRNGVKVIIPVRYSDKYSFIRKISEQLAYFESVYFDVFDGSEVNNDFSITRHEHFQISSMSRDSSLHICLDNVYYPIDFSKLGIKHSIEFPVALRFSLTDGVFPTPNRESLRYTKETIDAIKKKLAIVADYFVNKYNESVIDTEDVRKAIDEFNTTTKRVECFGKGYYDASCFKDYSSIQFKTAVIKGLHYHTTYDIYRMRDYMFNEYCVKYELYNGRMSQGSRWSGVYYVLGQEKPCYMINDKISGLKKDYMKSIYVKRETVYFIKKIRSMKLGSSKNSDIDTYMGLLKLYNHPKSEWRGRIIEIQNIIKSCFKNVINLDDAIVPQAFINSRKKIKPAVAKDPRRKKLQGEINCKKLVGLERYVSNKNSKLVPDLIDMSKAHQRPYLTVYGGTSHSELADGLFKLFNQKSVKFIILSDRELKVIKDVDLHNWISMDKFMEGKHIAFRRVVTAYKIGCLISDYSSVFNKTNRMKIISEDLAEIMDRLNAYNNDHCLSRSSDLYPSMIEVADANNLYDMSIYSDYLKIKELFGKLKFLNVTFASMSNWRESDPMIPVVIDLFKYHKQRINWKNYNIKLNEEVTTPISEELINEI